MPKKPIDPLFAEYARTAPLHDLRFYIRGASNPQRRAEYGPKTAGIVAEMTTLETALTAVIERGEKPKDVPKTAAAQKAIVWRMIDRYRASLPAGPNLIDGRPHWVPDPTAIDVFTLVDDDPIFGPRYGVLETAIAPEAPRPALPEPLSGAASELLFWDEVRRLRRVHGNGGSESGGGAFPPIGIAVRWSAENDYSETEAERAAAPRARRRGAARRAS